MTVPQALNVIEQALNAAATKGVFNLKDATLVDNSLKTLIDYLRPHFPEPTPEIETVETEEVN